MNLISTRGLTLTELMIVLAIIIITAAIAIPTYIAELPRQRLKAVAQGMLADLRLARARAVANNQPYLLCFDSTTTYKLASGSLSTTNCTPLAPEKTVDFKKNYKGVQFGVGNTTLACPDMASMIPINFVNDIARFNNRGSSVDGSGALLLNGGVYLTNTQDPNRGTYCVHVEGTTGRAKLYRWDAKSSPPAWK